MNENLPGIISPVHCFVACTRLASQSKHTCPSLHENTVFARRRTCVHSLIGSSQPRIVLSLARALLAGKLAAPAQLRDIGSVPLRRHESKAFEQSWGKFLPSEVLYETPSHRRFARSGWSQMTFLPARLEKTHTHLHSRRAQLRVMAVRSSWPKGLFHGAPGFAYGRANCWRRTIYVVPFFHCIRTRDYLSLFRYRTRGEAQNVRKARKTRSDHRFSCRQERRPLLK